MDHIKKSIWDLYLKERSNKYGDRDKTQEDCHSARAVPLKEILIAYEHYERSDALILSGFVVEEVTEPEGCKLISEGLLCVRIRLNINPNYKTIA